MCVHDKNKARRTTKEHCVFYRSTTEPRKIWETIYYGKCQRPRCSSVVILACNTFDIRGKKSRSRPMLVGFAETYNCVLAAVTHIIVVIETDVLPAKNDGKNCTRSYCFISPLFRVQYDRFINNLPKCVLPLLPLLLLQQYGRRRRVHL